MTDGQNTMVKLIAVVLAAAVTVVVTSLLFGANDWVGAGLGIAAGAVALAWLNRYRNAPPLLGPPRRPH